MIESNVSKLTPLTNSEFQRTPWPENADDAARQFVRWFAFFPDGKPNRAAIFGGHVSLLAAAREASLQDPGGKYIPRDRTDRRNAARERVANRLFRAAREQQPNGLCGCDSCQGNPIVESPCKRVKTDREYAAEEARIQAAARLTAGRKCL